MFSVAILMLRVVAVVLLASQFVSHSMLGTAMFLIILSPILVLLT